MSFITIDAEDADGQRIEVLVDRATAPRNGDTFEHEGQTLTRVISVPGRPRVKNYAFVSNSLPRREHAAKSGFTRAPHYDSKGRAAFATRREMTEYVAQHNDNPINGNQLEWDPDGNE